MSTHERLGSPVVPAPPYNPDRPAHDHAQAEGLPADRLRGSLSVVDYVRAMSTGDFWDADADDVMVSPEDQLVVKLALSIAAAIGPSLKPSGFGITKESPASRMASRSIPLSQPFGTEVGGLAQLFGRDDDRRSLRVWTSSAGGVLVAQDRYSIQNGIGALVPANVVLTVQDYAGPLWVGGPAGTVAPFVVSGLCTMSEVRNVPTQGSLRADFQGAEAGAS